MDSAVLQDAEILRKRNARVRKNGWMYPLHPYQIISWIFYTLDIVAFFLVIFIPLKHNTGVVISLTLILFLLIGILFILVIRASLIDPVDEVVKRTSVSNSDNYAFFWKICNSNVSDNSKHWGQWNKCVANFDHHWKWLNNWVGQINYRLFLSCWIFVFLFQLFYLGWWVYSIIEYSVNEKDFISSSKSVYSSDVGITLLTILCILIALNLLPLVAVSNLLIFHAWLYK